jgi:DnaK suppressor protein
MNRKESLQALRKKLVQKRDALVRALSGDMSLLHKLRTQNTGDMADAAMDSAQDDVSTQLVEVESRELERIMRVLRKDPESFGVCEGCATAIPLARLNALPYATHCIKCQREQERQGGGTSADIDWSRLLDSSDGDSEPEGIDTEQSRS